MSASTFRFRLERVRALRERRERLAQQELARSISGLAHSEARLQSADDTVAQARAEGREASGLGAVDMSELRAQQAYLERTEAERTARVADLRRDEAEVASRNASLATAAREHDSEVARREVNVLDEIATVRYGRSTA